MANREDTFELQKENRLLKKEIADWKTRISLATDFTQSEMDEKNVCEICKIPYHPDYCYSREENNEGVVCDVCSPDDI